MFPAGILLANRGGKYFPFGNNAWPEQGMSIWASPDAFGLWFGQTEMNHKGLSPKKQYCITWWFVKKPGVRKTVVSKVFNLRSLVHRSW